jgi:hypothetical protein
MPPRGCSTTTKLIVVPELFNEASLARETKSVVAIVTVGIPAFSNFSWSTTSCAVQDPQSAWDEIIKSGFKAAILAITSGPILLVP